MSTESAYGTTIVAAKTRNAASAGRREIPKLDSPIVRHFTIASIRRKQQAECLLEDFLAGGDLRELQSCQQGDQLAS